MGHMLRTKTGATAFHQRGATLIEVLVAILVLSIGLVGLAKLQITAMQGNYSAYLRSQATLLAYDMADRMRTNRNATLEGDYLISQATGSSCNFGLETSGSLAAKDKAEWLNSLACQLSRDAKGQIVTTGNNNTFLITVEWDDTHGRIDSDTSAQQFSTEIRL